METIVGDARSSIELAGWRARAQSSPQDSSPHNVSPHDSSPPDPSDRVRPAARSPVVISGTSPAVFDLGEAHYRRSEQTWAEAGRPTARISVSASGRDLIVDARVGAGTPVFARRDAVNPYDNEHPDINGHGMQLYVTTPMDGGAWTITPEADSGSARVRSLAGWGAMEIHGAQWEPLADGYRLRVRVALPHPTDTTPCPLALDVIINEMPHGRERRRGQLVLSGSQGEFVYLRGDRHDQTRLVPMIVVE